MDWGMDGRCVNVGSMDKGEVMAPPAQRNQRTHTAMLAAYDTSSGSSQSI